RVGHGADAPVIQKAAAVEHHALDALFDRALGDRLADRLGALDVAAAHGLVERTLQLRIDRRCRDQRLAGHVVDYLRVDVRHAAEHAQARPLFRSRNPLALPQLNADPAIVFGLNLHNVTLFRARLARLLLQHFTGVADTLLLV